ncbi:hypothetical protein AAX06_01960 [Moraxella bovoculi]|uniref:N-acetyltransferase domain-containing protein n=2 Tax=Moraxella bovoculi TaxID=386891 RepID=A0AAC8T7L7_9GAMM|nr:anti-CRISPR N-acetyltransferase AcrVA5 [Moraxella bovoculi]AKG07142.1 hypothetical protein AAX06_01960 [Moraxella bovoculi]AKG12174.1 hypothetical protein AAX07_09540 [Moraxella bovoculi]AKG14143.1 hypothetical protein AAX11_09085 [Moraxella bovoculi]
MKIELSGGYICYSIEEDEVTIDMVEVTTKRQGIGSQLIDMVKDVAREVGLPIGLYAYPQDDSISQEDLIEFYFSNDFEYDPDDVDGRLMRWS